MTNRVAFHSTPSTELEHVDPAAVRLKAPKSLHRKVVVVTGGAGYLGQRLCYQFLAARVRVIVVGQPRTNVQPSSWPRPPSTLTVVNVVCVPPRPPAHPPSFVDVNTNRSARSARSISRQVGRPQVGSTSPRSPEECSALQSTSATRLRCARPWSALTSSCPSTCLGLCQHCPSCSPRLPGCPPAMDDTMRCGELPAVLLPRLDPSRAPAAHAARVDPLAPALSIETVLG